MAIGKVNAYATVDAPKADFGAVAQLNIDNLVKSAKEDEQLKAAKKVAEDKAKKERSEEFGDFVTFDASGVSLQDQYSNKEAMDLLPKFLENKRLYKETNDPKYFTEGQRILGYVNGINKNTKVLKESVDRFAIAAGKDEIASKWSKAGIQKIKSLSNGEIVFGRGNDGNGAVATYEKTPDGAMQLKMEEKYPDWLSVINNAPNAVNFTKVLQEDKNLFERNLTETQVNALRKEGTKAISGATEIAIGKLAESKMNDDRFLAVYLSEIGETTNDDLRTSGFKDTEKAKAIEAYKKQLISLYGVDKFVDVKQAPTPSKGDGGGKAIKGQATVAVDNPYKLIKVGEVQGYNNGKNENVTTVPVNSLSFPINPSGMDKPELLDSSIGGKNGFTITPKSFYVSPDGDLLLHATAKAGEKIAGEGYSESTTTSGEEYVFSYKTNGTEFANALRGFLNTEPDLKINGRVRQIRTATDVFNYFDELEKSRGGKGLKTKTVSTGASNKTNSSNTTKSVAEKMREAANSKTKK
jgi:hypothetical protein